MKSEHPEPVKGIDAASLAPDGPSSGDAPGRPAAMYGVEANDPQGRLVDRSGTSVADMRQITALMQAMGNLRDVEERLSQASLEYMKLGKTDMRALHFLIVSSNTGGVVTASVLANHLRITSASTTKLLDRLERDGHITRSPHPSDRRSHSIHITEETRTVAMETVGAQQARRFHAAARLSPAERDVVIRFLRDTAVELETGMEWVRQTAGE
ncbi:MarR family winged helix-turn-helix transcriptional regulator [Corynebacterium comes]|uniref:MarR family protein n=1 Tax=Corynebacterium comes TaxID=2675218 RepID=A0A6B8VWV8_9CORY|nr:MarR family transcriptional regulator [Corynebacterium comes]QGU04207.1 MarR family protein [Corynebacterium comes]